MKILIALIFCSLLVACGKNNNSTGGTEVFSQNVNSNEVSRSGYAVYDGIIEYAYLLMTIDTQSPIRDFYLNSSRNPKIDQQVKSQGSIIFGRFNRGVLTQMDHLKKDLLTLDQNQRLDEIDRISTKAQDQSFFYIENNTEVFNSRNGIIDITFILENEKRIKRRLNY